MPRLFLLIIAFYCPLLVYSQSWKLKQYYPVLALENTKSRLGPEALRSAFAPDSVLSVYRPKDNPSIEELLRQPEVLSPNPDFLDLRRGDIIWVKLACINTENRDARYLIEAEQKYLDWSTVDIFEVAEDSVLRTIHTGNQLLAAAKPIRNARNLFWLDFQAAEQKTLMIRLVSKLDQRRPAISLRVLDPTNLQDFEGFTFHGYNYSVPGVFENIPHCRVRYSLEYFIDSTASVPFAELQQDWDQYGHFLRVDDQYGLQQGNIWCRFTLVNPDSITRYHLIDAAGDQPIIKVYLPEADGSYSTLTTGKKAPKGEKAIDHSLNLFDFMIGPLDTAQIYLQYLPTSNNRGHFASAFIGGIFLFEPLSLMTETRDLGLLKAFILGILFFQLLYFLLRSSLEKNTLGLYYALIIFGFSLLFIFLENLMHTFLALQIWLYQSHLLLTFSIIFFCLGIYFFTDRYLNYKYFYPLIHKLQKVFIIILIAVQLAYYLQTEFWYLNDGNSFIFNIPFLRFSLPLFSAMLLLYIILAVMAHFRKIPYATNFLIAFSPFFLTMVFLFGQFLVAPPIRAFSLNAMYGGFILTSVLFATVGARRHNEMKIKEAQADSLIELDKAKSEFYSNITHEFRTPLTVIMGLTDTIHGHEREKELIKKNGQEVLDLVQQLLDISKAQSGMLQLKLIDDNIVPYLDYLIESFHALAKQKKIDLRFNPEQEEIIMAYDREKVKFILNNLVANAIKFTPAGGNVFIQAWQEQQNLLLKVRDTGIGLSPEDQERIFDRFYQANKNGAVTRQGDGIGLALLKDLAALLNGTINVTSTVGKGTTFAVTLPLRPEPIEGNGNTPEYQDQWDMDTALLSVAENEFVVLVVEDNIDVLFYIERILTPNYKVVKAYDGNEGWKTALDLIPDIIINDVMMPEMDGYQLTAKLKEDPRTNHIPVILLTARAAQEDKVKGLEGGADAYLVKPFHEEELRVRINKLIESRRKLQESFAQKRFLKPSFKVQDPFLVDLFEILEKNYQEEDFGIHELVAALHMSRMQVHRKLKALTNYSTSQLLNSFRLEKGKALLAEKGLTISEIAYSCGFGDPGYFSKLFVKKYGLNPQAYRKQLN